MPFKIGLFACELLYPDTPPHLGMCLFIPDLRDAGMECAPFLVNHGYSDRIPELVREEGIDLVALESIFPLPTLRRLIERLDGVPVVVGGVNALTLFLNSRAEYAVVGPGRAAALRLAISLNGKGSLDDVPNLFYRTGDGRIDHSGIHHDWRVEDEVLPYRPEFEWSYIGPQRSPGAALNLPSVIPEFGCQYCRPVARNPLYDGLAPPPVPAGRLTGKAVEAVARHLAANEGGCSFCIFRNQRLARLPVDRTVDLLIEQTRHLRESWGTDEIFIQTENPFRFLLPFLERAGEEGLLPRRLHIRTMPVLLVRHRETVERCLAMLAPDGGKLFIKQLGFESFVQRHLDLFNKGVRVEDNIQACRIMLELSDRYGRDALELFYGHGLILFHPWCTLEELEENLDVIRREAPFLTTAGSLSARLMLYNEFTPIFRKALAEGLAVKVNSGFGWDFRYQDRRMEYIAPLTGRLIQALAERLCAGGLTDQGRLATITTRSQFPLMSAAAEWVRRHADRGRQLLSDPLPEALVRVVDDVHERWRRGSPPGFPEKGGAAAPPR